MKKYSRLWKYLTSYKKNIVLYFLFTLLSIVFSLVSLGTLPFFLRLIFGKQSLILQPPAKINGSNDLIQVINYKISHLIAINGSSGPVLALGIICIVRNVTGSSPNFS